MSIEVKRTGVAEYGRWIKVLICGDPGAGKTLISSTFPNPIYASAEGGLMSIADRGLPYVQIKSSEDLLSLKMALEQEPSVREKLLGAPIDTLVVDTIDEIQRILIRERLESQKKESMALQDFGWLAEQMRSTIRGLRNLEMNVVFTAHLKSSEDSETGRQFHRPGLQGGIADELPGYVDLALLLKARPVVRVVGNESRRVIVRTLQTYPDPMHPWVKDRSGKLPQEFNVTFQDDYKRIEEVIYGGIDGGAGDEVVVEAAVAPVTPLVETTVPAISIAEVEQATPVEALEVDSSEPAADISSPPVRVDVTDGRVSVTSGTTRAQLEQMKTSEKMTSPGPWECEECGTAVESQDQRDLSVVRFRLVLCGPHYKAANEAKRKK